jgi:predicted  nucleic acid-binding Zn-ribbon protein
MMGISNETRLAEINAKISAIRQRISGAAGKNSRQIRALLAETQDLELSPDEFQEFLPDAEETLNDVIYAILSELDNALRREAGPQS